MTQDSRDEAVTVSGGTMVRLTQPPRDVRDLLLEPCARRTTIRRAAARRTSTRDVVSWHYGVSVDVLRVVRDDARGLVAWLPAGSTRLAAMPRDGRAIRDRSLEERAALAAPDGRFVVLEGDWHSAPTHALAPVLAEHHRP